MASVYGTIVDLVNAVDDLRNRSTTSLTEYTKITSILHRAYIQDSVFSEEITIPLVNTLLQLNVAYVLTAIGLGQRVVGTRTIRDVLRTVATENYLDVVESVTHDITDGNMDMEYCAMEVAIDTEAASKRFAAGQSVEVEILVGSAADGSRIGTIKANLYVQIISHSITEAVTKAFFSINFTPSTGTRWMQVRAGELSLIKDMILARDLIAKQAKALKEDRTGILSEIESRKQQGFFRTLLSWIGLHPENHNTANTIIILEQSTFNQACHDAGLRFSDYADRERFFKKSMAEMVVVVDTRYNMITLYLNGIEAVGEYDFKMINSVSKGNTSVQIKDIMSVLGQGNVPRF